MKILLFVFFLINSICIYAESQFTFRGEIRDYNTQESITGALINFYSKERLVETLFSNKSGNFEFVTTELIDHIEVKYIGNLTMKITEIDLSNKEVKDFFLRIPLFENPFSFISYERKPTSSQIKEEKKKQKFILKGVRLNCKNNNKVVIKCSRKRNEGYYQFVKFTDLFNCEQ
jgi:hypothetical protein